MTLKLFLVKIFIQKYAHTTKCFKLPHTLLATLGVYSQLKHSVEFVEKLVIDSKSDII